LTKPVKIQEKSRISAKFHKKSGEKFSKSPKAKKENYLSRANKK
jgi:hypothetical protein